MMISANVLRCFRSDSIRSQREHTDGRRKDRSLVENLQQQVKEISSDIQHISISFTLEAESSWSTGDDTEVFAGKCNSMESCRSST